MIILIIIAVLVILIILYFLLRSNTENFEDKVKYENSKIIYQELKNNKVDFDGYKKKLKDHPELIDVTIYDKVKHLEKFTVDNIYKSI